MNKTTTNRYTKEHIKLLNETLGKKYPHLIQIDSSMKITYEGIGRLVMLDRYSQKDISLDTLVKGDLVIAKIKNHPKFPTLGTGFVIDFSHEHVSIKVEDEYIPQIDPEFKPDGNGVIKLSKDLVSKPLEIFYEQIAKRVAKTLSKNEVDQSWFQKFADEISSQNLVPAGRVLYGVGSGTNVTYFNCFVMPMPKDSREGISEHRKEIMEIMSRGGGVGTNGSTLRPNGTVALKINGKSSGAVSWLNDFASLTDLVQQGGSRRGAQMIMLQDWHPDIIEFIISKMQKPQILNWIAENFTHPLIKKFANDKMKFKPLTTMDTKTLEAALKYSDDPAVIKNAKSKLDKKGTYEVVWPEFLSGANISVGITKDFMEAVKSDSDYELKFPDIQKMTQEQKEFYDEEWHKMGDVREWAKLGYPVKVYAKIKAKELWDLINFCATYSAEPGVFFIDRANEMTNATSYSQKVVCTNPCGEQPLAPYSVCNLSAINLSNMVDKTTGEILWDKLDTTIIASVRLQDNIIDHTPYFLDENKRQAIGERRAGMGVMGMHDFLIWTGHKYGSESSNKIIDELFERIATTAYMASAKLAEEKGAFGFMNSVDSLLNTGFIKKMPQKVRDEIKKSNGLRNSHLLTIAPTGSTGTMIGVSTGLEPYFAFKYFRSGRLGKFIEVDQKIVEDYRRIKNLKQDEKLPDIFVSAMDLSPEAHVKTQVIIQRWIDSSISKTVNAPKGYTVKQVEKIYMSLYDQGAKGGTVYVDGSRDAQVLSIDKEETPESSKLDDEVISEQTKEKLEYIHKNLSDVPGMVQDKNFGTDIGDICPICKEGSIEDMGGCNTCTNCGAQLKCGL